jgi:hypothetical protein
MTAFVLGNGISRKNINLDQLHLHGSVYGCNALYREFVPDVLVATDLPIATQIQQSGYSTRHRFYTRRPLPHLGARTVPKEYYGNSSGPIACALAALDQHSQIYMLGFDLGGDQNQLFNNIYADTEFYKKTGTRSTYAGNWINQLIKIVKNFSNVEFCRVHGDTTCAVDEFSKIPNIKRLSISEFVQQYNCWLPNR